MKSSSNEAWFIHQKVTFFLKKDKLSTSFPALNISLGTFQFSSGRNKNETQQVESWHDGRWVRCQQTHPSHHRVKLHADNPVQSGTKQELYLFIYLFTWTRELDHLNKMTALIWSMP